VRWLGKKAEHSFFLDFFVSPELAEGSVKKKRKESKIRGRQTPMRLGKEIELYYG
jgi:hypothetical protein